MKKFLAGGILIFALLSQSAFASFTDVPSNYKFFTSISWMEKNGVVQGYEDGTFGINKNVNRAEFLKMLYETMGTTSFNESVSLPFSDVPADAWYTKYVKKAYADGIVNGYPDGTFKPDNNINLAEAVKIVANAFLDVNAIYGTGTAYKPCEFNSAQDPHSPDARFDTGAWSWKYIYAADNLCVISSTTDSSGNWGFDIARLVNRGDMAEMLYRAKAVHDDEKQYNEYKKYDGNMKPVDLFTFNEFNVADLKVGLKIGDLTVKSFGPFDPTFSAIANNNLKVVFEGEMTVTGKYVSTGVEMGCDPAFYPDKKSDAKMPHLVNDELSNQWFCFNNIDFTKSKLGSNKSLDGVIVKIKNYTYNRFPSEGGSTADLVDTVMLN